MRVLIALGGNALLKRGEALSFDNQMANINCAAAQLARVAQNHEVILTHGNGPQVGLLALQNAAYTAVPAYPLDVLGAQSQGMVGYLLEQALANLLPDRQVVSLITRVEVDGADPAFAHPAKPIGPMYSHEEAKRLAKQNNWTVAVDGQPDESSYRRVVASPRPVRVLNLSALKSLVETGALVIAAGGGGVPVMKQTGSDALCGVEAVIDKDLTASLLATVLNVDCLLIATDVEAVFIDWGKPSQRAMDRTTPAYLQGHTFATGSMAPKVQATCAFVSQSGKRAVIGSLAHIEAMLAGDAGTQITLGSLLNP
jgi:carbamate kinase